MLSLNENLSIIINDKIMENTKCVVYLEIAILIFWIILAMYARLNFYMMPSSGFLPPITRPTRVTTPSATLVDNVSTNYLEDISHSTQGLFITAASDYFPIFHVWRRMQMFNVDTRICKRLYSLGNKAFYNKSFVMLLAPQIVMK